MPICGINAFANSKPRSPAFARRTSNFVNSSNNFRNVSKNWNGRRAGGGRADDLAKSV